MIKKEGTQVKKFLSWLLIAAMAIGMCSWSAAETADVLDFEDGNCAFLGLSSAKANADGAAVLEVVDFNESKALKVSSSGVPYVALNIEGLAGERLADVGGMSFTVGLDKADDGKFHAASGVVYSYTGEANDEAKADWSVYMEKKNPRTVKVSFSAAFEAGKGNFVMISKEEQAGGNPVAFYLDNIQLLDKDGNAIPLDTSAEYVAVASGRDLSNLVALTGAVELEGFHVSSTAWSQVGLEMTPAFLEALVPGSVVEVDYSSADGAMWIVMPDAAAGWMRVGGCGNGVDAVNNSRTIAQIPYEMIVQFCGEDKSTWGARLQCESSSDWEVFGVRVGQRVNQIVLKNAVEFPGFQKAAAAWAQDGLEMPQEIIDALVPGSVVEITYESEDGDMWIVMPDAAAGWMRVSQGTAVKYGGKAYITYEEIEALCGEDKSTWGARMQCEGSSNWTVYSVRVGQKAEMAGLTNLVAFPGFQKSAAAWAQDGLEMPQEIIDALVPGSVVTISYESEDGAMWIVMPDAAAGWMRVGNDGADVANGSIAQVSYEQIAQVCGEDKGTWGARMQCESSTAWTVYSVAVGQAIQ